MESLEESVAHNRLVAYFAVASVGLMAYDYVVTLPSEVKHIWLAPWNIGKFLFLVNRYLVFLDSSVTLYFLLGSSVNADSCGLLYRWRAWSFMNGIAVSDVILMIRTWAIWARSRSVGAALVFLIIGVYVGESVVISKFVSGLTYLPLTGPGRVGCTMQSGSNILFVNFVLLTVDETFIFVLTLIKGIDHLVHKSPLVLTRLYQDGLFFTAILFIMCIINVVCLSTQPRDLSVIFITPQRVMHAVLGSRIILHLREASEQSSRSAMSSFDVDETATIGTGWLRCD